MNRDCLTEVSSQLLINPLAHIRRCRKTKRQALEELRKHHKHIWFNQILLVIFVPSGLRFGQVFSPSAHVPVFPSESREGHLGSHIG